VTGPPDAITKYSQYVEYWSLEFALRYAIESAPPGFEEFRPQLTKYFVEHMDFYMAKLEWLQSTSEGAFVTTYYGLSATMHYAAAAAALKELYKRVTDKDWTTSGNGGFDPKRRIWYPTYELPPVVPPAEDETADDGIEGEGIEDDTGQTVVTT
jgi:hypothetical protein